MMEIVYKFLFIEDHKVDSLSYPLNEKIGEQFFIVWSSEILTWPEEVKFDKGIMTDFKVSERGNMDKNSTYG